MNAPVMVELDGESDPLEVSNICQRIDLILFNNCVQELTVKFMESDCHQGAKTKENPFHNPTLSS